MSKIIITSLDHKYNQIALTYSINNEVKDEINILSQTLSKRVNLNPVLRSSYQEVHAKCLIPNILLPHTVLHNSATEEYGI